MTFELTPQLVDKHILLLRVFTAVYGSSVPASGLKQVMLCVQCACRACYFAEGSKLVFASYLVTA